MAAGENIPAAAPPVGVWDCVCTFGEYQHETVNGQPCISVHDASTCKVMLDDFAAHPDCDIFYDKQHEVADALDGDSLDREKMKEWAAGDGHALAWANALVMIIGGQVARYEAHPGAPETPPTIDELRQSDGSMRPDGVYCLRSQVTPRGADPLAGLAAFRFTSPYYVPEKNGNRLLNLTATNDPRMRDCALAFSRDGRIAMQRVPAPKATQAQAMSRGKEMGMDPNEMKRLMEAAGCKDDDKPEDKTEKMMAYASRMEAECGKEKEAAAAARKAMEDKAFAGKETDEEEAKEHTALVARIAALEAQNGMLIKELQDTRGTMQRFKEREDKTRAQEAGVYADKAVAMGRIRGDFKGDLAATKKWLADKWLKSEADAEDVLSAEGTFQPSEAAVMTRHTRGGAPEGMPDPRGESDPESAVNTLISAEIKTLQKDGHKGDLTSIAMKRVAEKNPGLWRQVHAQPEGRN